MAKNELEVLGLRKNALVITATSFFLGIGRLMVATFFYEYATRELGAPILVLGLFGTIQGVAKVLLITPLGYLSDRVGHMRKWIVVAGDCLSVLCYLTYAMAGDWFWLIPGIILETSFPIVNPVLTAIVSDSINPKKRGMALATRAVTTIIPGTFTPVLGGIVLDTLGMREGMHILFLVAALFRGIGTIGRTLFIHEEKKDVVKASAEAGKKAKNPLLDMFEPLLANRTLQVMALVSFASYIGMSVLNRFQNVFAQSVIGLTATEWGVVTTVSMTVGALVRIPLGKLADVAGRRTCILIDYAVRPIFFASLANAKDFTHLLILNNLNNISGETGLPAWEALIIDIAPRGSRGRAHAAFATIQSLSEAIFPSVAAFLWDVHGPAWAFYLPAASDTLALFIVYLFLKEPKQREV